MPKKGAVHSRDRFLQCVGPQNEVFEGSHITLHVCRGPKKQKKWESLGLAVDPKSAEAKSPLPTSKRQDWFDAMDSVGTQEFQVTLQAETENVRKTRIKRMEELKAAKNIKKMNVSLVNDFMYEGYSLFWWFILVHTHTA